MEVLSAKFYVIASLIMCILFWYCRFYVNYFPFFVYTYLLWKHTLESLYIRKGLICQNVLSKVFLSIQWSADKSFQCLYMYIELKELSLKLACQKCNWTIIWMDIIWSFGVNNNAFITDIKFFLIFKMLITFLRHTNFIS